MAAFCSWWLAQCKDKHGQCAGTGIIRIKLDIYWLGNGPSGRLDDHHHGCMYLFVCLWQTGPPERGWPGAGLVEYDKGGLATVFLKAGAACLTGSSQSITHVSSISLLAWRSGVGMLCARALSLNQSSDRINPGRKRVPNQQCFIMPNPSSSSVFLAIKLKSRGILVFLFQV